MTATSTFFEVRRCCKKRREYGLSYRLGLQGEYRIFGVTPVCFVLSRRPEGERDRVRNGAHASLMGRAQPQDLLGEADPYQSIKPKTDAADAPKQGGYSGQYDGA